MGFKLHLMESPTQKRSGVGRSRTRCREAPSHSYFSFSAWRQ